MSKDTEDYTRNLRWIMAQRVYGRRKHLTLTQAALAEVLTRQGTPLSVQRISQIERGNGLQAEQVVPFSLALSCTPTYLLGGTASPSRWSPDRPLEEWASGG